MSGLIVAACGVVLALFAWLEWQRRAWPHKRPPAWLWFAPSLVRVAVLAWKLDQLYEFFTETARTLGLVFSIHLPIYGRIYFLLHPDDVKHVLHENFANYVKGPIVHDNLMDLLGDGIFTTDGELWKKQRQAASHLFKKRLLDNAVRVILGHSHDVADVFGDAVRSGDAVDVQKIYSSFTMDSFVEIAFGRQQSTLKQLTPFSAAFDTATRLLIVRLVVPWARFVPWPRLSRSIRVVHEYADDVIRERKREFAANKQAAEAREDALTRFMEFGESDDVKLRDAVLNLILAGRDTTAQTLSWLSYLLACNQSVQDKLAAEVSALAEVTVDSLKSLTYAHACMDETLRLYPPVAIDIKQSIHEDTLPSGVRMPPDTCFVWSAYCMGRSELMWKDPTKFIPERWLGPENTAIVNGGAPFPFQIGPRVCLGMNFAYLEVKALMVQILPKFKFVVAKAHPAPILAPGVTLSAKDGVFLGLARR
jgi:cytochrome P450